MQRGSLGKTGTPPAQSCWNEIPRMGQQDHPKLPRDSDPGCSPEALSQALVARRSRHQSAGGPGPTASPA